MPQLTLPDLTLHYQIAGGGPPLLLIPGMLSDGSSWAPLMPALTAQHRVILPDPRGAGRTTPLDAPISLTTLAQDMLALADHLGHDRLHVAGHSMGGLVALQMAADAPARLSSLTVLGSTPLPSARVPAVFRTLCDLRETAGGDLWLRALLPWLMHDRFFWDSQSVEDAVAAGMAYPHLQPARAMRHQTRALARLKLGGLPDRLTLPALALLAAEDALIAPGPAGDALRAMGLNVEVLEGCAHSLHWDQPEIVAQRLVAWTQNAPD